MRVLIFGLLSLMAAASASAQSAAIMMPAPVPALSANCVFQYNATTTEIECNTPGSAAQPLIDSSPLIANAANPTKLLAFNLAGLTGATTRTWTIPDANLTIPTTIASLAANTFTALQTLNGGLAATTGTFSSTLSVTGATTLSSTLGVTGATTLAGLSATTGTFSSTLGVTGATTLAEMSATTGAFSGRVTSTAASTGGNGFVAWRTDQASDWRMFQGGDGTFYINYGSDSSAGNGIRVMSGGDMALLATKRLYFDGTTGHTFIGEVADNDVRLYTNGSYRFRVTDSVTYSQAIYDSTTAGAANVVVGSIGQLQRSTSSLRYKADVQPFAGGLADLLALQPVSFVEKKDPGGPRYLGFTAEALDAAGFTNVVTYDAEGRPDSIQYDRLIVYVVNALKELTADVDALRRGAGQTVARTRTPADTASRAKAIERVAAAKATAEAEAVADCIRHNERIVAAGGMPVACEAR